MIENLLLLKALRGEAVERPPVWMMRQAGRYLPEYMVLRRKYDFFTRVQTPELACEITLQPIELVGPDAAIIFSDILTVPQAMGLEVQLVENKGPFLPNTIKTEKDIDQLVIDEAAERMQYVYDALALTKSALGGRAPLIGFAGAPFTILCYMVEGQGSKAFSKARKFCFQQPALAQQLLQKITAVTITYLQRQISAGADCIQVFDSWSGLLGPADFDVLCAPYVTQICDALDGSVPVIYYPKGSWYALENLSKLPLACLGLDWTIDPATARTLVREKTLQGNLDPAKLYLPPDYIREETHNMIRQFGTQNYIANLGHGISPDIPVDHARAFVDAVKSYHN